MRLFESSKNVTHIVREGAYHGITMPSLCGMALAATDERRTNGVLIMRKTDSLRTVGKGAWKGTADVAVVIARMDGERQCKSCVRLYGTGER